MSEELKTCPFCGSDEANWEDHPSDCYLYIIQDQFESFKMKPVMDLKCTEDVHAAWNTRQPDLAEDNRLLKAALEKIKAYEQSYCGTGAATARWTTCEKMRKIATETLDKYKGE